MQGILSVLWFIADVLRTNFRFARRTNAFSRLFLSGVVAPLLLLVPLSLCVSGAAAAPDKDSKAEDRNAGKILHIFDDATVYVITNDDVSLAENLLENCHQKERRVLSIEDWQKLPESTRFYFSAVFLINRERLPANIHVPEKCPAENDELYIEVQRSGRSWGVAHDVIISAPDSTWLREGIAQFRQQKDRPRHPLRSNVSSLAIIPYGTGAVAAAQSLLEAKNTERRAHLALPIDAVSSRLAMMDEVVLVDRSASSSSVSSPAPISTPKVNPSPFETIAWRERKPSGHTCIVLSAPTANLLGEAVRIYQEHPLRITETPTVIASARDLRAVRRVAVAGVRNGTGGSPLAKRLANKAASDVRALDAFEVLERAGLSQVLGEIALGQAGITQATDRAKVRRLAAADALLIVEVTDVQAHTEYRAQNERITPLLNSPPRRPSEPSRLRYDLNIQNNGILRNAAELILGKVVGTKTDQEYKEAMNIYNCETLPQWQQQLDQYNQLCQSRPISWKQRITAESGVTVSGSMRVVDLSDGLVLWESPFSASDRAEIPHKTQTITTYGEDSTPDATECPAATNTVPDTLLNRAADAALTQAIQKLSGSALLPSATTLSTDSGESTTTASTVSAGALQGKILDIDDTILVALGSGDGIKTGDLLTIHLSDNTIVRAKVTHVRPRTCDATLPPTLTALQKSHLEIGQLATKERE